MSPDKTAIEKLWDKHSYDFELWGVRHRIMNQAGFLAALSEAEGERWISVREALEDCEDYFDNRADADHNGERYIANKEMVLLGDVREAIAKAKAIKAGNP